jgi:CDP-glucose 4,6-dehydratase
LGDDTDVNFAASDYYRGKRVLVTGHTGFKGGWLAMWLKQLGAEVCGVALAPGTEPNFHDLAGVSRNIESHIADLGDSDRLHRAVAGFCPEIVFHLAAQALVLESYRAPVQTYLTNVIGSLHVLEAVRRTPSVRTVLMITSDKVYHNDESGIALREDDRLGGADPYSSSKAAAEIAIQSWRRSFFQASGAARIASVRAGNVFGGGDWCANRLLPDIVRAVARGEDVVLRHPGALRPWQHVLDALSGYLVLGARLDAGEPDLDQPWNFGPLSAETITVKEFAERAVTTWKRGRVTVAPDPNALHEAGLLRLDSRKSAERLGWRPLLRIDEAIDWSIRWYAAVLDDPGCAPRITAEQLRAYTDRIDS